MFGVNSATKLIIFEVLIVTLFCVGINHVESYKAGDNPRRRGAFLDAQERYRLEWMLDQKLDRITFNVTVRTRGWVSLGFANDGGESSGQDMVLGGVHQNGIPYFSDRHRTGSNKSMKVDKHQDYTLESSWGNGPLTFLSFSRALDTCDNEDYRITESKVTLIWSYGTQDDEDSLYLAQQGTYDLHLLDPEYSPRVFRLDPTDPVPLINGRDQAYTQVWTISQTIRMPKADTSYICSIHKAPQLPEKHHVVGFDVYFPDEQSRNHTPHLVVYRCIAPRGSSARALFESYAKNGEQRSCLDIFRPPVSDMPTQFCTRLFMEWSKGGREFFIPSHVGLPFGEDDEEYYMLQPHLDNPAKRSDVTVRITVDFFYTSHLRPNEGGMMGIGTDVPGLPESMLIPPGASNVQIFGHCSAECTRRMFPREGITLVAARLQTHKAGRTVKLHHFRKNEELPVILYDDNYTNDFQQFRALPRGDVKIYPGDQLTMDCTYDNTEGNSTILSGFGTRQETCLGWLLFYNLVPDYTMCTSGPVSPAYRERFLGVSNVTWYESKNDWVAQPPSPRALAGRRITDISDNWIEWVRDARSDLQEFQTRHAHLGICRRNVYARDIEDINEYLEGIAGPSGELVILGDVETDVHNEHDYVGPVKYPFSSKPYRIPVDTCSYKDTFKDDY